MFGESAFADTLLKCKIKDKKCQMEFMQKIIVDISETGALEIGIPPIDPFMLTNISVNVLNSIDITLKEGHAKGIKNCIIDRFEHSLENERAYLDMTCNITVKGKYKVFVSNNLFKDIFNGESLRGEGNGKVKIEKLKVKFDWSYSIQKRNGEIYIKCKADKTSYKYEIMGNMLFAADNLYIGDVESSKVVTGLLNENWKVLVVPFLQPFMDKAMEYSLDYLHKFFDNVPLKHYITDDLSAYARH
ncbi:unnamed protein product [Arctia plantaginis]|uniref:Circadian clock-controlled protein n=1 Tax=Arctia plantaginis TaxID=874455 RepID=A0A8S1AXW6_ARCPL|nr:unnamed protein product [Arctia plantaginis]